MIHWDVNPEIFSLDIGFDILHVRWYGVLFALSFLIGYQIFEWMYKRENKRREELADLLWYMMLGTVIGARLGHCLFYNPGYYLSHPLEILYVWHGGLASHGAAIGILISLYLYTKKVKTTSYLWLLDRMVITVALAGFFIRMGNLFNSEIVGMPSDMPWAFLFVNSSVYGDVPRHPAQLYEAIGYLIIFIIIFFLYKNKYKKLKDGFIFGIFLTLVFSYRFFIEYFKVPQIEFNADLPLRMGQMLSIPLVIYGIYLMYVKRPPSSETVQK